MNTNDNQKLTHPVAILPLLDIADHREGLPEVTTSGSKYLILKGSCNQTSS
jgi:hypothetical protein